MSQVRLNRELLAEVFAWLLTSIILGGGGYLFLKPIYAALTR